jgi:hypothetical protein
MITSVAGRKVSIFSKILLSFLVSQSKLHDRKVRKWQGRGDFSFPRLRSCSWAELVPIAVSVPVPATTMSANGQEAYLKLANNRSDSRFFRPA